MFGSWHTQEIPVGYEIIGLKCHTKIYSYAIPVISFVLRLPNPGPDLKLL